VAARFNLPPISSLHLGRLASRDVYGYAPLEGLFNGASPLGNHSIPCQRPSRGALDPIAGGTACAALMRLCVCRGGHLNLLDRKTSYRGCVITDPGTSSAALRDAPLTVRLASPNRHSGDSIPGAIFWPPCCQPSQ
jgi:hypothetical protein